MNTRSIERVGMMLWLVIACWLGFLAFRSRKFPKLEVKPILWTAFLLFTFLWLPVAPAGFGVITCPPSFIWVEAVIAFPVYDGSERFSGIPPPQLSMVVAGFIALLAVSAAALNFVLVRAEESA